MKSHSGSVSDDMDIINTWMLWKRAIEEVNQTQKEMYRFVEGVEADRKELEKEILDLEQQPHDLFSMGKIAIIYQEIERLTVVMADAVLFFDIRMENELIDEIDLEEAEKGDNLFGDLLYDGSDDDETDDSDDDDGFYDPKVLDKNPSKAVETESGSSSGDPVIVDCYADWSVE